MFKLGRRILSKNKNILECLEYDLEFLGISYIKERYRTMTTLKTLNNEYNIYFDRVDSNSPYGEYLYLCSMEFKDILGISKLRLEFNELTAYILLDNLVQYCNFGQDNLITLSVNDIYMNTYTMMIEIIDPELCIYQISIDRYNPIYGTIDHVLHFQLSDDLFNDMTYFMYFSYLIDLDDNGEILPYLERVMDIIPDE